MILLKGLTTASDSEVMTSGTGREGVWKKSATIKTALLIVVAPAVR